MQAFTNELQPKTQYIKRKGARTLHHGVRLARTLQLDPNLFVTIKFWETSLDIYEMGPAFARIREKFAHWIQRPRQSRAAFEAPPTFLWVLENPDDLGQFHAHWLVFVPVERQMDFAIMVEKWLRSVATKVYSDDPIHIEPVWALLGAQAYMLKGQMPATAKDHKIEPEYQGWIPGRRRSGSSRNIGPTQHERLWKAGKHPSRAIQQAQVLQQSKVAYMQQFVAYYRVSTDRQGTSGLGLEAQRCAALQHVGTGKMLAEFTEVESGKRHTNRPQLLSALQECRKKKAALLIAKLDRLGRNVAFISALMDSGVDFVCCDNPHANRLMLHMLAAFAEHEAATISERTKAALAAAKARGVKLGNPSPLPALNLARAVHVSRRAAPEVLNVMRGFEGQGMSYRGIARELNRLNIRTGRGCEWFGVTVKAALQHR